jgi:hypothetical protein
MWLQTVFPLNFVCYTRYFYYRIILCNLKLYGYAASFPLIYIFCCWKFGFVSVLYAYLLFVNHLYTFALTIYVLNVKLYAWCFVLMVHVL